MHQSISISNSFTINKSTVFKVYDMTSTNKSKRCCSIVNVLPWKLSVFIFL